MMDQILRTKLYIPQRRQASAVVRPRLIAQLQYGVKRRLTLVSAPAGFGKTTLVTEWLDRSHYPTCWLSLDASDSEPERFLMYVIAALQTIESNIGQDILTMLEQSPQSPAIDTLLTPLLNDIINITDKFLLVLDDFHVIDNHEINKAVTFIIDHQPPQMHLVIITREDPQLPLSRLRARGELTEIRIADLRFTQPETTEFLNKGMGLGLSNDAITLLETRTEGWVAGLQMAAISMSSLNDKTSFLESFTGSHRFILDYLVEEVIQGQPDHIRDFLFQTAILTQLTASLCNAVTGRQDSQEILELLERSNMLIIPLDNGRRWYRYHHLFADVLRTYAVKEYAGQVHHWHEQASIWYEQQGFRIEAIHYAFAADNFAQAADLVERTWPEMFYGVRPMTWLEWARKLPDNMVVIRPVLSAAYAWMLLDKGEVNEADRRLDDVERWLQISDDDDGMLVSNEAEFTTLAGSTAGARAYLCLNQGNFHDAIEHAQKSLQLLTENDHFWRGNSTLFLGLAQWSIGDLELAYWAFAESVTSQSKSGSHYFETFAMALLGDIRMAQGQLREAQRHYQQALDLISKGSQREPKQLVQGPVALYVGLSELHREWDDLEAAEYYVKLGHKVVDRAILPGSAYRLASAMARLCEAQGDAQGAFEYLRQAEDRYQPTAVPDVFPIGALRAKLWLRDNQVDLAQAWARQEGLSINEDLTLLNVFSYITFARILIAEYQHKQNYDAIHDATSLLRRLSDWAESHKAKGSLIEILIVTALFHQSQNNLPEALEAIKSALQLAEREGYVRLFIAEGQPMREILSASLADGADATYVSSLINRIDHPHTDTLEQTNPNQLLIEPLSNRELDVLYLIAQGHSNQSIADELVIAISTVKKHTNNLFGKLGVSNRTQAVARASELNIL